MSKLEGHTPEEKPSFWFDFGRVLGAIITVMFVAACFSGLAYLIVWPINAIWHMFFD